MDFFELIENRYSVREYQSRPVEAEKLNKILEAANLAPTAGNRQPFCLILIKTEGRKDELKRIYGKEWFVQAPIVIAACAVLSESWTRKDGQKYADVDTTIAMDHLILAAASLGLGTCWIAAFDPAAAREILQLPDDVEPIAFTPLGYPDDELRPKKRKNLKEIVHYEKW